MSYDLMVFDPEAAPLDRDAFMRWFEHQAEWSEDHDYDDPAVSTPALRAWFAAIYEVLLGESQGPRFGGFIAVYGVPETVALIEAGLSGDLVGSAETTTA